MQNLLDADEGKNHTPYSDSRLLNDVKTAMIGATKYALKRGFTAEDRAILQTYIERINLATTGNELLAICEEGEELVYKYKPAF